MIVSVATGLPLATAAIGAERDQRRCAFFCAGVSVARCWAMHSGQMTPTAAGVRHSGHTVRRHR
ncbi:DUF933 domain-containing protein [Microbacterium sp. TL13]|nr:DUF933 domain-containing protein [Microbacterium sp. TL13]